MTQSNASKPLDKTEETVCDYFEERGWTVIKLDTGNDEAADFRICRLTECFLCEVKTINSVRSNFPFNSYRFHVGQRKKKQEEIEKWQLENPNQRLILPPGEREYIFGDEAEFKNKYHQLKRNTEADFKAFDNAVRKYFEQYKNITPYYALRIYSQDMYSPTSDEQDTFFKWLKNAIILIDKSSPGHGWFKNIGNPNSIPSYSCSYQFHEPKHENDSRIEYHLTLEGPIGKVISSQNRPEMPGVQVNTQANFGLGLNLDAITAAVKKGVRQLNRSASRESNQQIPRIVVLHFMSNIITDWEDLSLHLEYLLKNYSDLSAIAVLSWKTISNPPTESLMAWVEFSSKTPYIPTFNVFYNSQLQNVKPLPTHIFNDDELLKTDLPPVDC